MFVLCNAAQLVVERESAGRTNKNLYNLSTDITSPQHQDTLLVGSMLLKEEWITQSYEYQGKQSLVALFEFACYTCFL